MAGALGNHHSGSDWRVDGAYSANKYWKDPAKLKRLEGYFITEEDAEKYATKQSTTSYSTVVVDTFPEPTKYEWDKKNEE